MIKKIFPALLAIVLLTGCVSSQGPQLTPLEIQSMQTRSYSESQATVFKSMISVFQDLGYRIVSADLDTGLITAESTAERSESFWTGAAKVHQTKANAFVERIGKQTKIRLSFTFAEERSTAYGREDKQEDQILDAAAYQNAFEKLENAIFVRSAQ